MSLPAPFYNEGGITIYCGDNRRIVPLLDEFDLLLTDPPYGGGYAANPLPVFADGHRFVNHSPQDWDNAAPDSWVVDLCRRNTGYQVVWGGNYFALPASRCWLSWHKPDAPPSMANVEYAWTNFDRNSAQMSRSIAATNAERVGHPTQKPLPIIGWCMEFAADAQTVLDPWMGSGTTLVAAKLRGLRAVGIEINKVYCEAAVARLSQGVLLPC